MSPPTLTAGGRSPLSSIAMELEGPRDEPSSGGRLVERVWFAVALALAGWVALVAGANTPDFTIPLLVLACVGAVWVARRVGGRWPTLVPATVALLPLSLSIVRGGPLSGGPLSYANASASLFFVAAGAALLVSLRSRSGVTRLGGAALFAANAVVPWLMGSYAAGLLTVTLPVALLSARRPRGSRPWLVSTALFVVASVAVTVVLGATYVPGEREGRVAQLVDATLTERRVQLWSDAIDIIADRPLTGIGPGGFRQTSPTAIANPDTAPAHSEVLQLAAESGVVGGLLGIAVVLCALARLRWVAHRPATAVAVAVVGGIGVHASMDYVLHFALVPLSVAALLGAELGAAYRGRHGERARTSQVTRARPIPLGYAASAILVAVGLIPWGLANPPTYGPNGAAIAGDGWIGFAAPGLVRSVEAPRGLYRHIATGNAFSVELWARTSERDQRGPARLVSSSGGIGERNFTIGQERDDLVVRLRTSAHDPNGTDRDLRVPDVFEDHEPHHLALIVDGSSITVHVDGRVRAWQVRPDADLTSWDRDYPLLIGNEVGSGRPWIGELRDVRFYDVALPLHEIPTLFQRGPTAGPIEGTTPLAWYRAERRGTEVRDASARGMGGILVAPDPVATPPADLIATATDTSQHAPLLAWDGWWAALTGASTRALRIVVVFAMFWAWAIAVSRGATARWPVGRSRARTATVTVLGAAILATAVEYLQYAQGRSPSAVDVVVGVAGAACAVVVSIAHRQTVTPAGESPTGDAPGSPG